MATADMGASTVRGFLTSKLCHAAEGTQVGELYNRCGIYRSEKKVPKADLL